MFKNVPLLTSTIQAYPVFLYQWVCPKCKAQHLSVKVSEHEGEPVIKCLNGKCGEIYTPDQFKFQELLKIKTILNEMAPELYKEALKLQEKELQKEEMASEL